MGGVLQIRRWLTLKGRRGDGTYDARLVEDLIDLQRIWSVRCQRLISRSSSHHPIAKSTQGL
jgi:hypothetical protein